MYWLENINLPQRIMDIIEGFKLMIDERQIWFVDEDFNEVRQEHAVNLGDNLWLIESGGNTTLDENVFDDRESAYNALIERLEAQRLELAVNLTRLKKECPTATGGSGISGWPY